LLNEAPDTSTMTVNRIFEFGFISPELLRDERVKSTFPSLLMGLRQLLIYGNGCLIIPRDTGCTAPTT
jgi:hypothetical protein